MQRYSHTRDGKQLLTIVLSPHLTGSWVKWNDVQEEQQNLRTISACPDDFSLPEWLHERSETDKAQEERLDNLSSHCQYQEKRIAELEKQTKEIAKLEHKNVTLGSNCAAQKQINKRQETTIVTLRKALKPFAERGEDIPNNFKGPFISTGLPTADAFRAAADKMESTADKMPLLPTEDTYQRAMDRSAEIKAAALVSAGGKSVASMTSTDVATVISMTIEQCNSHADQFQELETMLRAKADECERLKLERNSMGKTIELKTKAVHARDETILRMKAELDARKQTEPVDHRVLDVIAAAKMVQGLRDRKELCRCMDGYCSTCSLFDAVVALQARRRIEEPSEPTAEEPDESKRPEGVPDGHSWWNEYPGTGLKHAETVDGTKFGPHDYGPRGMDATNRNESLRTTPLYRL